LKAKDYLRQLKMLDRLIENKLAEKEQWKAMATSTTQQLSADRVQTSGNPQKMADAVCKIIEIEAEIDACIDNLVDTKRDVIKTLERLNPTEYDLLHKVYVQFLTFEEVADKKGKSYSWVTTVHGRALKNVQRILDGRRKQ
jgi:DNA-directed RNA polymerase specialized sigma24 family protein